MAERRREDAAPEVRRRRPGRLFVSYTLLRLATFGGVALVLYLLGFRELPLVLTAIVVSAVVSVVAFRSQRAQLTEALEQSAEARRERRAAADAEDEARARAADPGQ